MHPAKRRRVDNGAGSQLKKIESLEQTILTAVNDGTSLNGILDLLVIAKTAEPQQLHKLLFALYRIFSLLISQNQFHSSQPPHSQALVVRKWLLERLDQYLGLLEGLLDSPEPVISQAAAQIPFSLLKALSSSLSNSSGSPQIHYRTFHRVLPIYLNSPSALNALVKLVQEFDDIRWFTLREIAKIVTEQYNAASNLLTESTLYLLESITRMPEKKSDISSFYVTELGQTPTVNDTVDQDKADVDDWRTYFDEKSEEESIEAQKATRSSQLSTHRALHSLESHRIQFSRAWLALLQRIKTVPEYSNRVLTILHRSVLPHLVDPLKVVDWIGACIEFRGSTSLLAFNALFVLIQEHNLDYPDFYTRLYSLLDRNVLHTRYRARFFRLLELFLSSTHLPATILASFAKRLARLSLNAPPAAIVMIVPFIYNILKRHPSLMGMIHREFDPDLEEDPFLPNESSPLLTNAQMSSLWEINSHRLHYMQPVSTMAKIFSEAFTKPSYLLEDFLDHTYGTLYTSESKRRVIQDPALGNSESEPFGDMVETRWRNNVDPCRLWAR